RVGLRGRLQVQVPPLFGEEERAATVQANRDGTVECHADARPPPTYTWIYQRTGQDLAKQGGRFNVDGITGALHVSPVQADDEGLYWCVASNPSGETRQQVRLAVQVPPRAKVVRN
ncbi:Contactin, partial [Gryllus bimaculatus]